MSLDAGSARRGLGALMEASSDRLAELALLTLVAIVKAINVYQDRRSGRRPGRRATDRAAADLERRLVACEQFAAEHAKTVQRLTSRVRLLEAWRDGGPKL